jgi:hypothetical protein
MHIQSPERTFYCLFNPGKPASNQQGAVGKQHLLSPYIDVNNNINDKLSTGIKIVIKNTDVLLTPITTIISAVLVPFLGLKRKFGEV